MGTRKDKVVALLENPCQCSDSQPGYPAAIIWDNFKPIDHESLPFTHSDFIEMGYTQAWELFKSFPVHVSLNRIAIQQELSRSCKSIQLQ